MLYGFSRLVLFDNRFSKISFQQFVKLDEFVVNVRFQFVFIGRH